MQNPVFARIVSTQEYRVQGPPMWIFRNGNQLLSRYPGADGVKTGYTDNAGRCLVFSATRDGRRAISVVLDSNTQWDDSIALAEAPTRVQGLIGSAAYYLFGKRAREIELFDGGG